MHQLYCIAAILAVALSNPLECWGFPGVQIQGININGNMNGMMISAGEAEHENGFYIITNGNKQQNGKCTQKLEVHKNNIIDNFEAPCSNKGLSMLNTDVGTFCGGSDSPFTLYSNEPSSIVVIENGKCTKKVYITTGKKTTSVKKPVDDNECKTIKQDIAEGEEKNRKYWEDWRKTNFPPCFPSCDKQSSQSLPTANENSKPTGNKKSRRKKKKKSKSNPATGNTNGFSMTSVNQNDYSTNSDEPTYGNQHGSISGLGNTYVYGGDEDSGDSINPGVSLSVTNHGSMSGFGNTYVYGDDNDSGDSTNSGGNQNEFYVNTNTYNNYGGCYQILDVHGSDFTDTFRTSCSSKASNTYNTDEGTIYGGSQSPLTLYSYEPSSLVVIENGKCTKIVYTTTGRRTKRQKTSLSNRECKAIRHKVADTEEYNKKYWTEWGQNFSQTMQNAFPPCFPFCN